MRNLAGFALSWASVLLAVVAVLIGSPALFYITTAMISTILACHLQAYLAVRGLRIERVAPESVKMGDLVTVELTVWSLKRIRRTLITVIDNLPDSLTLSHRSLSLPIAPAFDRPIRTQYQLRAIKRGLYKWSGASVMGTDALGLIAKTRLYETAPAEMMVLPRPIPLSVEIPSASGWGVNESESGQTRGAGIEPRGIRQYRYGDSLRHVHWASTAKANQLLVKEFEAGTEAATAFCIQRTPGSDIGSGAATSLEQICGNVVFLAEILLRQGARVYLPGLDEGASHFAPHERINEIYTTLATVAADNVQGTAEEMDQAIGSLPYGSSLYLMLSVVEDDLPYAISRAVQQGLRVSAFLYDSTAFVSKGSIVSARSSIDPEFTEAIRGSGAHIVVVPVDLGPEEGAA